ncbi:MAG: tyrosine-type recombinase/integrase [Exilispira sp.]|jgi:integrase/recombinase XerC|nr:tyrosine-type recombinase/integrase [Exilispira sp.]
MGQIKIIDAVEVFCSYIQKIKQYSINTYQNYYSDLVEFSNFAQKNWKIENLSDLSTEVVRSFLSELRLLKRQPTTLIRKRSAIHSFIRFCEQRNFIQRGVIIFPKGFRGERKLPEFFTKSQISSFINFLKTKVDENDYYSYRDYIIILLLTFCGIRASELIMMKKENIDLSHNIIKVTGKGKKQRIIPFPANLKDSFEKYLNLIDINNLEYLFCNKRKIRLTRRGLFYILSIRMQQYGSSLNIHPHKLRHTFATLLLENGADIRMIQKFLGHESIATTEKYTQLDKQRKIELYKKFHPHA